jgi:hypothetical protein
MSENSYRYVLHHVSCDVFNFSAYGSKQVDQEEGQNRH